MKEKNKVIVLGNDHTNTIGVVQCLGKEGFYVIAVLWGEKTELIKSSNYTKKILSAHTPQECINLILSECVEEKKIPIIPCCDTASSYLINNKRLPMLHEFDVLGCQKGITLHTFPFLK